MSEPCSERALYVYNKTREAFVATSATVADGYQPLAGLLGRTKRWAHPGAGLWDVCRVSNNDRDVVPDRPPAPSTSEWAKLFT